MLTVQNFYKYLCISEIYLLYSTIISSKRDTSNVIILPRKTNMFLYIASKLWNSILKRILNENGQILTTSVKLHCKTIVLHPNPSTIIIPGLTTTFTLPLTQSQTNTDHHSPTKLPTKYLLKWLRSFKQSTIMLLLQQRQI